MNPCQFGHSVGMVLLNLHILTALNPEWEPALYPKALFFTADASLPDNSLSDSEFFVEASGAYLSLARISGNLELPTSMLCLQYHLQTVKNAFTSLSVWKSLQKSRPSGHSPKQLLCSISRSLFFLKQLGNPTDKMRLMLPGLLFQKSGMACPKVVKQSHAVK